MKRKRKRKKKKSRLARRKECLVKEGIFTFFIGFRHCSWTLGKNNLKIKARG